MTFSYLCVITKNLSRQMLINSVSGFFIFNKNKGILAYKKQKVFNVLLITLLFTLFLRTKKLVLSLIFQNNIIKATNPN